ncbi:MAG: hypothetical protein R2827_00940 [Bdellovibrionales bacterium]
MFKKVLILLLLPTFTFANEALTYINVDLDEGLHLPLRIDFVEKSVAITAWTPFASPKIETDRRFQLTRQCAQLKRKMDSGVATVSDLQLRNLEEFKFRALMPISGLESKVRRQVERVLDQNNEPSSGYEYRLNYSVEDFNNVVKIAEDGYTASAIRLFSEGSSRLTSFEYKLNEQAFILSRLLNSGFEQFQDGSYSIKNDNLPVICDLLSGKITINANFRVFQEQVVNVSVLPSSELTVNAVDSWKRQLFASNHPVASFISGAILGIELAKRMEVSLDEVEPEKLNHISSELSSTSLENLFTEDVAQLLREYLSKPRPANNVRRVNIVYEGVQ